MRFISFSCLFLLASLAQAASLYVTNTGYIDQSHGYQGSSKDQFSGYLDNEFGTVSTGGLNDLQAMLEHDALWVTLHDQSRVLTTQETSNLDAFIATGRRVLMVGEHDSWDVWNTSMLSVVGATAVNYNPLGCCSGTASSVATHELLTGVSTVKFQAGGIIDDVGSGLLLFDQAVAALWGDNVLGLMDLSFITDPQYGQGSTNITAGDNAQFASNTATWLAGSAAVPVPAAAWLFGSALTGLGFLRRRRNTP